MTDEVKRISKLVAEGKLSPEDAALLIDAFYASERSDEATGEPGETPPPPPGTEEATKASGTTSASAKDPLRAFIDLIEKVSKESTESVNWQEVSQQARTSAKKGLEFLRSGIDELSKGKVNFNLGWLTTQETRDVTLPITLTNGKTLRVENAVGDVKIVGGFDVGSVTAKARFRASSHEEARSKADNYTPIIEESDHLVLIRQPDVSGLHVDLEIQMPGSGTVEVRAESGDISVLDTKGGCRISGRSGDVKVRGLNGVVEITGESGDLTVEDVTSPAIALENKSGDITVTKVRGNLNARTATGDVTVRDLAGKSIAVESVSGTITLDITEPVTGSVNVRTVNGDAAVTIVDGADCRVTLSTLRGSVSTALDLVDCHRQDQRITGRLGNGSGTLDVSAVTGDIDLSLHNSG